jgi:hypothetical protein
MFVSFLLCPNSNANMTIQARYSPVTVQPGHTISNQKNYTDIPSHKLHLYHNYRALVL